MRFLSGKFFAQLVARFKAWKTDRSTDTIESPLVSGLAMYTASIHRDVTPHGVRFYNLCGCCGARLQASATLCEECAQRRRPARPI